MARREDLCRSGRALPVPARAGDRAKVGIAIGLLRAGYLGALAAWTGFTLPSAIALVAFGYGFASLGDALGSRLAARAESRRRCGGRQCRAGA